MTGALLLLAGITVNTISVGFFLSDDRVLDNATVAKAVMAFQGLAVTFGIVLLAGIQVPRMTLLRAVACLGLLGFVGAGFYGTARMKTDWFTPEEILRQRDQLDRMLASESVHLKLTPRFKKLGTAAKNLRIPSAGAEAVFAQEVLLGDVAGLKAHHGEDPLQEIGVHFDHYEIAASRTLARADIDFLRPVLDRVSYFDHAKFGFVAGDFVGEDLSQWRVKGYFKGVATLKDGERAQMKGGCTVLWKLDPQADVGDPEQFNEAKNWTIHELVFSDFHLERAPYLMFSEELANAVPDTAVFEAARANPTKDKLIDWLQAEVRGEDWEAPHPFWDYRGAWDIPTVSVVDIDGDGFDDFYKTNQWAKNQLFHNQGDGTFKEIAAEVGLDVEGHTNCALFADFDNDGDQDVFLGRSLEPSQYLVNEGGRFVDRTAENFSDEDVYFVGSASAADYDGDGLLDLYVSTYAAQMLIREVNRAIVRTGDDRTVLAGYLPERHGKELLRRALESMEHFIHDRVGPPNLLMKNAGEGRFELQEDSALTVFRNTYQSTWADVDGDGDEDLYLANDFAYNNMFRNDGNGVFTDITAETGSRDVGFGMGCSWGDVDRDGDQDLYVSNMFSKAGNRIVPSVEGVDPRFLDMAAGNTLFAWNGSAFDRVSSKDDSGFKVEVGGWAWGAQFVDVDNDGWLDIYGLNGYYSAPKLYRDDVDL